MATIFIPLRGIAYYQSLLSFWAWFYSPPIIGAGYEANMPLGFILIALTLNFHAFSHLHWRAVDTPWIAIWSFISH